MPGKPSNCSKLKKQKQNNIWWVSEKFCSSTPDLPRAQAKQILLQLLSTTTPQILFCFTELPESANCPTSMPKLDDAVPFSLAKLRERYCCSHNVLMGWLSAAVGTDHTGKPCTVLDLLEKAGYKKKQSYLTPRQWQIITQHVDAYLKTE